MVLSADLYNIPWTNNSYPYSAIHVGNNATTCALVYYFWNYFEDLRCPINMCKMLCKTNLLLPPHFASGGTLTKTISIHTWFGCLQLYVRGVLYTSIDQKIRNKLHGPMHYTNGFTCVFNGHEIITRQSNPLCFFCFF